MKLRIRAIASDIESMEKLINEYFFSKTYYIEATNEKTGKVRFIIKNRKGYLPFKINEEYKVILKKGKYYFYRVIDYEANKE